MKKKNISWSIMVIAIIFIALAIVGAVLMNTVITTISAIISVVIGVVWVVKYYLAKTITSRAIFLAFDFALNYWMFTAIFSLFVLVMFIFDPQELERARGPLSIVPVLSILYSTFATATKLNESKEK